MTRRNLNEECCWSFTSADRLLCALIYQNGNFDILSTETDRIILESNSIKPIREATKKRLDNCPSFDFSPNNQKFVICLHNHIYISDISDTPDNNPIILPAKIENVYFVSDEILVCLASKSIHVLDIKRRDRIMLKSNNIDAEWDNTARLRFLNRQRRTILGFYRGGRKCDTHTKFTLLLDFDGNVTPGPSFKILKANMDMDSKINQLIVVGYFYDSGFGYCDHDDDVILDLSDYASKGIVKEMKNGENEKYWEVFGVPAIKVEFGYNRSSTYVADQDCGDIVFETNDKVAGQDKNYETNRHELITFSKKDFVCYKLATLIGCGLLSRQKLFGNFLTRGLYDPRLFLTIWDYCCK